MNHQDKINIMQAFVDGRAIQSRKKNEGDWGDNCDPNWNWDKAEFRIKPEPKTIWVNEYEDGSLRGHNTEQCADRYCRNAVGDVGDDVVRAAVKYQEVTE